MVFISIPSLFRRLWKCMTINFRWAALAAVFAVCTGFLAADTVHVLQKGETLYSLSRQYGVPVKELLRANGIADPSALSVGTKLNIPGVKAPGAQGPAAMATYTVKSGDTYYSIARKNGLSVDELLKMNARSSSRTLRVGESLVIRSGSSDLASSPASSNTAPAGRPGQSVPSGTGAPKHRPAPASAHSKTATRVGNVPWWPVAGVKTPLDGKLVGVKIDAEPQSYVHAVASGNVVWTGPYRGFGHVVLVDSNGYIYLYGGNEDLFVNVGQSIDVGSRIGRLGTAGPDGEIPEMIFSVFREGVPVSPDDAPRG